MQKKKQTIEIPGLSSRAFFSPESLDEKNRTVEVRWTTGAKVRRGFFDPFNEELSLNPDHIRLERMNSGAPLLNAHSSGDINDQIGVVEPGSIKLGPDGGYAKVRFSEREQVEPIFQDVKSGIIRNLSVGYRVHKYEDVTESDDKIKTFRAIDWEPMELSLVPIGADAGACVRSAEQLNECVIMTIEKEKKETSMSDMSVENKAQTEKRSEVNVDQVRKEAADSARKEEQQRTTSILELVRKHSLKEDFGQKLIADGVQIDKAREMILDELASRSSKDNIQSHIHVGRDLKVEGRRQGIEEALMHRANSGFKQTDAAKQYRGMSLIDMARECVEAAGGSVRGLSKREIAQSAFNLLEKRAGMQSTSDFPEILGNTINKSLRNAYELAPRTFVPWTRKVTVPDFKEISRAQLSELSSFREVLQNGEYKAVTLREGTERYHLRKYGGIINVTWEAIINDDMDAFGRLPVAIANEAAQNECDIVYGILSANAALSDGVALFHATHANYTATGTAINVGSLGIGRAMMRRQVGLNGRLLNLAPAYLLVGPDKEAEAYQYTSASVVPSSPSNVNPAVNTALKPIVDPRISGNRWHLVGEPSRCDTIEYAYLEGEEGIFTEQRVGFEVDGLQMKARQVFAAKAIDFRNMYLNNGA